MNNELLQTIKSNLDNLTDLLSDKYVVIFGMNHPGDFIIRYLGQKGVSVSAVIDNNPANNGIVFEGVPVTLPENALSVFNQNAAVLICSKYCPEMLRQLERMGYKKDIHIFRLLNIGGGGEFSLDESTFAEKAAEAEKGAALADKILSGFSAESLLVCPVKANGDVFLACSFLNAYLARNEIKGCALVVVGNACESVAEMYDVLNIYTATQREIELLTAAYRMLSDKRRINILQPFWNYSSFINRLDCYKGLNFIDYYKHWVFGLGASASAEKPQYAADIGGVSALFEQNGLPKGKTVMLSPFANSLSGVSAGLFEVLAEGLLLTGFCVATNVAGSEAPIAGTVPLSFPISDLICAAEYAGAFVGIRNGLCDILSGAACRKAVIYPQKAYGFGTARELYSVSDIGDNNTLELVFDGDIQGCVNKIINYLTDGGHIEQN